MLHVYLFYTIIKRLKRTDLYFFFQKLLLFIFLLLKIVSWSRWTEKKKGLCSTLDFYYLFCSTIWGLQVKWVCVQPELKHLSLLAITAPYCLHVQNNLEFITVVVVMDNTLNYTIFFFKNPPPIPFCNNGSDDKCIFSTVRRKECQKKSEWHDVRWEIPFGISTKRFINKEKLLKKGTFDSYREFVTKKRVTDQVFFPPNWSLCYRTSESHDNQKK